MLKFHGPILAIALSLLAAAASLAGEVTGEDAPDANRLDVSATFGNDGGKIVSKRQGGEGEKVLHGVQVVIGPGNRLQEYAVYNNGVLEQRTQFYPNGRRFRFQRREHDGDGDEIVYAPAPNDKTLDAVPLLHGAVKADRRWAGTFLVWAPVANGFGLHLVEQQYGQGKLIKSTPFSAEKLGLPKDAGHEDWKWPWSTPDWPE